MHPASLSCVCGNDDVAFGERCSACGRRRRSHLSLASVPEKARKDRAAARELRAINEAKRRRPTEALPGLFDVHLATKKNAANIDILFQRLAAAEDLPMHYAPNTRSIVERLALASGLALGFFSVGCTLVAAAAFWWL